MNAHHDSGIDSTTRRLVDFALAYRFEDLPASTVHAAKARLLDSIAVGLAAYAAPPVRILRKTAPAVKGPWRATLWGTRDKSTPDIAALVNGSMVRYFDLNDAYRTLDASHPSDNLPGLMAVVEALGLSGRDLILAAFISYEIQCRFTDTVAFNAAGWDQPLVGAQAAALAAGRIMGLNAERLAHALSLAAVPHMPTYQTRSGELSMWKGCAGPNGARHGIFAARLAQEGMTGPYNAYEGIFGLWKQGLGKPAEFTLPIGPLKAPLGLNQTNIKRYPVRDSCQLPIDTALQLHTRLEGRPVRKLKVETYKSAHLGAVADPELWAPQTRETADHSMPFSIAAALADGQVTSDAFEDGRFLDRDILELIAKMSIDISADYSKQAPGLRNCRIEAELESGEKVVAHHALSQADIEKETPDEVIDTKFNGLLRRFLPRPARTALSVAVARLDTLERIDPIIDAMVI
jgi:2-methylcitrate dehydratase